MCPGLREKVAQKLSTVGDRASLLEEVLNGAEKFGEGRELSLANLPTDHIKSLAKAAQVSQSGGSTQERFLTFWAP